MTQRIPRRDFLKGSVALAMGGGALQAGAARAGQAAAPTADAKLEWRNKRPEMRYRKLGRTGFMISEMVCGGDPISPTNNRHVELAIEMGLNYLDTAPEYGEGQSERGYGAIIQGAKRDRVFVNTKISAFPEARFAAYEMLYARLNRDEQAAILREVSEDIERRRVTVPNYFGNYFNGQIRQVEEAALANAMEKKYGVKIDRPRVYVKTITDSLEGSLKRLQTDHVDLMMCPHACSSPAEVQIHEIYEAFELLRKQGKVRYLGVSAHNDPAGVLKAAIETGVYSLAMVACNILNWHYVAPMVEEAYKQDFGVIAMKTSQVIFQPDRSTTPVPERAALLEQTIPGDMNLHQKAYRFVLNNPHVSAAISQMENEKQVRENLPVVRA
ncbi:MAG: aldo/keto reductase [Terriglobia bacterium]|jgi:aryl-alcohol dehydrogenase-like predicted oxidoreductase